MKAKLRSAIQGAAYHLRYAVYTVSWIYSKGILRPGKEQVCVFVATKTPFRPPAEKEACLLRPVVA